MSRDDDEQTLGADVAVATDALARAIQEIVGKAAHESAHAAGVEAVAVMRQIPDAVRRHVDDVLGRHGVGTIPDELRQSVERIEAVAAQIEATLEQSTEANREHLEKTLL